MTFNIKTVFILLALFVTFGARADSGEIDRLEKSEVRNMSDSQMESRMVVLEERLSEINEMDLNSLDRAERKALKQEVKYINKEAKALGNGGIYISTGALVVIIIILIIL